MATLKTFSLLLAFALLACNNNKVIKNPVSDTISRAKTEEVPSGSNSFYAYNKAHQPNLQYHYDSARQIHDYSGNWDLDADGTADSILFIGNGGAHLYFHLRIILSTHNSINDFPFLEFDMPYAGSIQDLEKASFYPPPALPQFIVHDFDKDGTDEIYLHLNTMESPIPAAWQQKGLTSGYILLDCEAGKITLKNFVN